MGISCFMILQVQLELPFWCSQQQRTTMPAPCDFSSRFWLTSVQGTHNKAAQNSSSGFWEQWGTGHCTLRAHAGHSRTSAGGQLCQPDTLYMNHQLLLMPRGQFGPISLHLGRKALCVACIACHAMLHCSNIRLGWELSLC